MANEKRLDLIERNALKRFVCEFCNSINSDEPCEPADCRCMSIIDQMPTVDAVEVADHEAIVYKLECLLCHATGGQYSKAGYSLEDMERMVTDYIEECCQEAVNEEVRHAYWIDRQLDNFLKIEVKCSECGWTGIENYDSYVDPSDFNYCPNCGAMMDGDGNV